MDYETKGVCSKSIIFDIKDNKLIECRFIGGCPGNGKALCKCLIGKDIDWIIENLKDIKCKGVDGASCPDQLTKALIKYKENKNGNTGTR